MIASIVERSSGQEMHYQNIFIIIINLINKSLDLAKYINLPFTTCVLRTEQETKVSALRIARVNLSDNTF